MKKKQNKETNQNQINKTKEKLLNDIIKDKHNKKCFDCKKLNPKIISLYNGIFICKECARNIHSKLNKRINLLIDNNLESLSLKGIQYLYYGGNKKLSDFINYEYPILKTINKDEFYFTKAMFYYRQWLKYLVNGGNKPIKPPYTQCYHVNNIDIKMNQKEDLKIVCINNKFNKGDENSFMKILKREENRDKNDDFFKSFYDSQRIKTLILDNEDNYFHLTERNQTKNLNEKTIKKGVILNNKYNSFLNNSLKLASNKIYTKPVILTQPNFQLNSHSFSKKRNLNIDEYHIKYSNMILNRNNNNILPSNNYSYDNSLIINLDKGENQYENNNCLHNKSNYKMYTYNLNNFKNTHLNSMKFMNNSVDSNNRSLNTSGFIFKKKNLKNSFSKSRHKKENKNRYKFDNISMTESNSFQIISESKDKIKKIRKVINFKQASKKFDKKHNSYFHTINDIGKNEKKNSENELKNNNIKQFKEKFDINKLLNLIIEKKKKYKQNWKQIKSEGINKMFLSKNNKKIIRISENTEKVQEKKEENGYVKDNSENNLNKENGGNNSKIDLFNTCRYNFYVKH